MYEKKDIFKRKIGKIEYELYGEDVRGSCMAGLYGWGCTTEVVLTDCGRQMTVSSVFDFEG